MQTITIKLHDETAKKIDLLKGMFDYGNRTDFIRDAIRDKVRELEKEQAWKEFEKLRGSMTPRSDAEFEKARAKAFTEFSRRFEKVR